MTYLSRSAWGARLPTAGPGPLERAAVDGIAFHWPAMPHPLARDRATIAKALRDWQAYHMDGHGWSDIGYQLAVDQAGRVWTLRGLRTQSGANGDRDVNERFCAVLLIVAAGEQPTPAMMRATRDVVADARRIYPGARRLVGHQDVRPEPTSCPGPIIERLLRAGAMEPTEGDDDMSWTNRFRVLGRQKKIPARAMLQQTHNRAGDARTFAHRALRQANRNADAIEVLAEGLAPDVARRVVEKLGERVDVSLAVEGLDE